MPRFRVEVERADRHITTTWQSAPTIGKLAQSLYMHLKHGHSVWRKLFPVIRITITEEKDERVPA